ncbi:DoxX family protein [Amycolatopsis sp. H20-H5]|uniref:DoxX family protein n=1 Tax=Amycolatopsis sp. H20-H5 TaxID=3046309 RepID=UPI002DB7E3AC|nr:DoxX family protein [Amycolatopsis sp. H20-H5]MEC3979327.1 DoxX family protein [Amycolatopsis sp. H20-H5]
MNVVLWIVQGALALLFLMAGVTKVSKPKEKLAGQMKWVVDSSPGFVKFVGAVEVLGALGLVLPALTKIATVLTPLAAVGLAIVSIGAVVIHVRAKEPRETGFTVVLTLLAVFVAWGRFGPYAF